MKPAPVLKRGLRLSGVWVPVVVLALAGVVLAGCGKKASERAGGEPAGEGGERRAEGGGREEALEEDEDATPEEKAALRAARPFLSALARGDAAAIDAEMAAAGRAAMTAAWWVNARDATEQQRLQAERVPALTPAVLEALLARTQARLGRPVELIHASTYSVEEAVLSGRNRTGIEGMDTVFAIGAIPDAIPAAARRASIHAQYRVVLSAVMLEEAAKSHEMTVDELLKSEDFEPYLNLKVVLVDEAGKLKVGYFELNPPSIWD